MENSTNGTTTEVSDNNNNSNVHQIVLWLQVPIGVFIIIANVVTLAALPQAKKIAVTLRILFGNMAIADTMVGIIFVFNCIVFYNINLLTMGSCIFRFGVMYMSLLVSMSNISMMALDRCLTIKFPFKYVHWMNVKKAIIIAAVSWCFSIFLAILSLFRFFTNYETCIYMKLVTIEGLITPGISAFVYLLVVIVCYFFIISEVRRHANAILPAPVSFQLRISVIADTNEQTARTNEPTARTNEQTVRTNEPTARTNEQTARTNKQTARTNEQTPPYTTDEDNPQANTSNSTQQQSSSIPTRANQPRMSWKYMNATKTVTVIFAAYICLNMPLMIILLDVANHPLGRDESDEHRVLTNTAFLIMVLNSVVNPIIYQLKLREMRAAVLRIFCKVRCENRIRDLQDTRN